jgi:adenylosuccinate synthase
VTGKVDGLAITNLDRLDAISEWRTCGLYTYSGQAGNVAEYFEQQGSSISKIKVPGDPTNLTRQEELTKLLFNMQPIYEDCKRDKRAYIELISQTLNLPVAITSAGPTTQEKESNFPVRAENPVLSMLAT